MKRDARDICAGVLLMLVGGFFFIQAFDYGLGTTRRMGPGYFPMALGAVTFAVGLVVGVPALLRPGILPEISWRPLLTVLGAIGAFGLCLVWLGFVPAVFASVCIAASGTNESRPWPTLVLAAFAALSAWLIFVVGLSQPLPAFRRPF